MNFKDISEATGIPYHKLRVVLNNKAVNVISDEEFNELIHYFENIIINLINLKKRQNEKTP